MRWRRLQRSASLVVAALAMGGCTLAERGEGGGNGVDRAFVAAMVQHHQSAVAMAKIARKRGKRSFVKQLARDVIWTQSSEIEAMRREDAGLELAGVDRGSLGLPDHQMESSDDLSRLRRARPFDRRFIDMMIPHHQGAIRMARVEQKEGADPELKRLAGEIIEAQAREIERMNAHRMRVYGAASPAGGVPSESDGHG